MNEEQAINNLSGGSIGRWIIGRSRTDCGNGYTIGWYFSPGCMRPAAQPPHHQKSLIHCREAIE